MCKIFEGHSKIWLILAKIAEGRIVTYNIYLDDTFEVWRHIFYVTRIYLSRQAVRNMLAALRIPDVGDDELNSLTHTVKHIK